MRNKWASQKACICNHSNLIVRSKYSQLMLFFWILYCCSITAVSIFPLWLSTVLPLLPTVNPHPVVHVHGSFLDVPRPVPSPSLHPYPRPPSWLVTVRFCKLMNSKVSLSFLQVIFFCGITFKILFCKYFVNINNSYSERFWFSHSHVFIISDLWQYMLLLLV